MTYITIDEVKEVIPTEVSDSIIQALICFIDQADTCLESNSVPDATQKILKLYAVAHMLTMQSGGQVKSESDMDGASVSYNVGNYEKGLSSSEYGNMVKSMDTYGCISALLSKPQRFVGVI